jgi:integrase
MARKPTGQIIPITGKRGRGFAVRFRAYGHRYYHTLGYAAGGMTEKKAEMELQNILADVRRGIWTPPKPEPPSEVVVEPTFHEFASDWFENKRRELRPNTVAAYEWEITHHLLPFFARHRLSEITVAEIDRYKNSKVREREIGRRLSNETINKTLTRLAAILETAVEYGLIDRNPALARRRRLKVSRPQRSYLDTADQIAALQDAAGELDREARSDYRNLGRRAMLSTLIFAGLRIGELCALRWRDVDLASGRLRIGEAKTDAGVREVELLPTLRDELATHKVRCQEARPEAPVFGTTTGREQNPTNIRRRVLARAVDRANEKREAYALSPLPERLTQHSLRRTFASLLFALGRTPVEVMDQLGHTDPKLALRIYARAMRRDEGEMERLRAGAGTLEWAGMGRTGSERSEVKRAGAGSTRARGARLQENPEVGAAGFEPATSRV